MSTGNIQDTSVDFEEKFRGYLFGTACADALGRPVEHLTLEQIQKKYGAKGILEVEPSASWTEALKEKEKFEEMVRPLL